MNIREKVARAIYKVYGEDEDPTEMGLEMASFEAAAAINTFLKAAAEQGWHMRPDEATIGMIIANCELDCGYAVCHKALGGPKCVNHDGKRKYSVESWETMIAAAPEFKWKDDS